MHHNKYNNDLASGCYGKSERALCSRGARHSNTLCLRLRQNLLVGALGLRKMSRERDEACRQRKLCTMYAPEWIGRMGQHHV